MNEQDLRAWLNQDIRELLTEIELTIPVRFTLWTKDFYACQVHKSEDSTLREVEIYYKVPLSQAKFAHELLHAKTSIILGDNTIMLSVERPSLPYVFLTTHEHMSNIGNVCEHNIFFPNYLAMGFAEEDSFEQPIDLEDLRSQLSFLSTHYLRENGRYSVNRVLNYLSLLFSFLFYPNDERFKKEVKQLRKIDVPLFSRVKKLKDICVNMEIIPDNRECLQDAYLDFANDMNDWLSKAFKSITLPPYNPSSY